MLKPQTENKLRKLHHHSFTAPSHRGPFSSTHLNPYAGPAVRVRSEGGWKARVQEVDRERGLDL